MLAFRRVVRDPLPDTAREVHFLLHSALRAYVVRTRGVAVDKRLFAGTRLAAAPGSRALAQIVLSGRMRLADGTRERWLEAGDVSLQPHGFPDERWEGERFEVVVLEWTAPWASAPLPAWTTGAIDARDRERLARWAAITAGAELAPAGGAAHVASLLELVAALGVPIRRADAEALVEPVPASARAIAVALGATLSNLDRRPAMIDLEHALGHSARHLRRGLAAFDRYYTFPDGLSWRRLLHRWRLSVAATLMTAGGATTEQVAAVLGYGAARSLCLAMAQAGLPSPGRIARRVEELR